MNAQWLELLYALDAKQAELLYDVLAHLLDQIWDVHGLEMIDHQIERDEAQDKQSAVNASCKDEMPF